MRGGSGSGGSAGREGRGCWESDGTTSSVVLPPEQAGADGEVGKKCRMSFVPRGKSEAAAVAAVGEAVGRWAALAWCWV